MRYLLFTMAVVLVSTSAEAQSKPVCDAFTDAEIADLLGTPATAKRPLLGAQTDCLWTGTGVMFTVNRMQGQPPEVIKAVVDSQLKNPGAGDVARAEEGIGDAAVSTQGRYGRSVNLTFRTGSVAWTMNLEKVDQKLDVAAALPKLKALAKRAVSTR